MLIRGRTLLIKEPGMSEHTLHTQFIGGAWNLGYVCLESVKHLIGNIKSS